MVLDKAELKNSILRKLRRQYGKTMEEAHEYEIYYAVSRATLDYVVEKWYNTKKTYAKKHVKQIYYFSAEFLMGRYLGNNLINLQMNEVIRETLSELGVDINKVEDQEIDTGLGNGGLGRLAACFLDSMATLKLPGHGYGLRYKYGMFEQRIENGFQVEYPDNWTKYGDPWSIKRMDRVFEVKFGGKIEVHRDEVGKEYFKRVDTENVLAVAYDVPIIGYGNDTVNTLRLWEAHSINDLDLGVFNQQDYLHATQDKTLAEDISRVLYPNDSTDEGKKLRLRQQYFFVSASLQDIVKNFKKVHGREFTKIPEFMEGQNYDVVGEASDGIEAVEVCKKLQPDIVLLDIKIPYISGLKVANILKEDGFKGCVIILTAYNIAEYIQEASNTIVMGYILKPIDESIFLERLKLIYKNYKLYDDLKKEVEETKKKLEERKVIERAKGIVMAKYTLSEEEAYKKMRDLSMQKRITMFKLSEIIILTGGFE